MNHFIDLALSHSKFERTACCYLVCVSIGKIEPWIQLLLLLPWIYVHSFYASFTIGSVPGYQITWIKWFNLPNRPIYPTLHYLFPFQPTQRLVWSLAKAELDICVWCKSQSQYWWMIIEIAIDEEFLIKGKLEEIHLTPHLCNDS